MADRLSAEKLFHVVRCLPIFGDFPGDCLQALFELVAARRVAVKAMVHQGKSLAEINAALPEAKVHELFLTFNETTYHELTRGYPDARPPWVSFAPNDPRRHSAAVQPPR